MKRRLWKTLESSSVLAIASLASGCDGSSPPQEPAATPDSDAPVAHDMSSMAPAAGEGTGGEGEGASEAASLLTNDAAYLAQIGLMRGHLWVGHQLYLNGYQGMADTHMKHPQAEIYSTLVEAFTARGVPGFADELTTLADRVTGRSSDEEVQAAYDSLAASIDANEREGANVSSAATVAAVIVSLLRTAGEEYAIGIVDEQVANVHEYQDALGFTQIARQWATSPAFAASPEVVAVAAKIQSLLDGLLDQWPSLAPEATVPFGADRIYGAAARIELDAIALRQAARG